MSLNGLRDYLDKIDKGLPVNLMKLTQLLGSLALSRPFLSTDVVARKVKWNLYQVTEIEPELLAQLRSLVDTAGNDRVSAASQNNSHQHKVNGSLLMVRKGLGHPSVAVFDGEGGFRYPFAQSKKVLLIENRENYIRAAETVAFLQRHTALTDVNIDELDVVFAAGNEVSNALHQVFFAHYEHRFFCFDVDAGGLQVAKNMLDLLPGYPATFLVPADLELRLIKVNLRAEAKQIDNVISLGMACPDLLPFAKLIKKHQRTLEQESYLYGE
jgi:hypothetical protein